MGAWAAGMPAHPSARQCATPVRPLITLVTCLKVAVTAEEVIEQDVYGGCRTFDIEMEEDPARVALGPLRLVGDRRHDTARLCAASAFERTRHALWLDFKLSVLRPHPRVRDVWTDTAAV
jgi:hypothetical protein